MYIFIYIKKAKRNWFFGFHAKKKLCIFLAVMAAYLLS